jgi:hypothetical protein
MGFMSPADLRNPDVPIEPEVDYEHKPSGNFTIVTRANVRSGRWGSGHPEVSSDISCLGAVAGTEGHSSAQRSAMLREETPKDDSGPARARVLSRSRFPTYLSGVRSR